MPSRRDATPARTAAGLPPYEPQRAVRVSRPPSGPQWVHEIKLDGYRLGCVIRGGRVRLLGANGRNFGPVAILNVRERLAAWRDDPWRDYFGARQRLR